MTLKLLYAGKDSTSFQPVKTAFDDEDVLVITATSMALAIFLARKNQPHLIISEQKLIDGEGISLFYESRNEPELSKIPFAFLLKNKQAESDILDVLDKNYCKDNLHFLFLNGEWKSQILKITG